MPACSNCQTEVAAGTAFCPSCGAAMGAGAAPAGRTGATPQIKFDISALSPVDRIVGIATVVLFIDLFLPWYSYNSGFGVFTLDAVWHGYMYIPLLISIAVVIMFAAAALGLWTLPASSAISRDHILLVATSVSFIFVLIAFLDKPGGSGNGVGWAFGAFVGLIAAIAALVPLGRPFIEARRPH